MIRFRQCSVKAFFGIGELYLSGFTSLTTFVLVCDSAQTALSHAEKVG
jgi:hypothetical protein